MGIQHRGSQPQLLKPFQLKDKHRLAPICDEKLL
jgi:hypothetical protein